MRASVAYDTTTLLAGDDDECHDYLEALTERVEDRGAVCADVPAEAFEESVKESDDPDITMYGTTSLASFAELVRNATIDTIVQVQYKYPTTTRRETQPRKVSHIVVVGPEGFQLCTCLKLMRCGLHCGHVLAALVTRLDRASDFIGESIHPRWRSSTGEWSLRNAGMGDFERAKFTGGYTNDDFEGAADCGGDDSEVCHSNSLKNIQGKAYADYVAKFMKWASAAAAKLDGSPGSVQAFQAFVSVQEREFKAFVEGPGPEDGLVGLGNPPISLPKGRKETRHKDAQGTEGGGKRRSTTTDGGVRSKKSKGDHVTKGSSSAVMNAVCSFSAGR